MMLCKYFPATFIILMATIVAIKTERDYVIEILQIKSNVSHSGFFKTLRFFTINMNMVNSELMFERNVTQWTVDFNFDFLVKGKRQVNLFHTQLNACQLLKDSTRNKFLALFMKEVKRTSNYPSTCPFAKDTLYALRNYTIDPEDYPATFPAWQWRFDLNSVFNKIYALNVTVKGRIRKT